LLCTIFTPGVIPSVCEAQRPVSLREAMDATLRGPSTVLATLDTAAARARVVVARSITNPTLNASYTENTPRQHVDLAFPLDFVFTRGLRLRAAQRELDALELQLAFQQASARYQITGAYVRAAAAEARARLSRSTAADADSLLQMATLRERTGDASRLEVELARINRGDAYLRTAQDSFDASASVLEVQRLMALPADSVRIALSDSLARVAAQIGDSARGVNTFLAGTPLSVAVAVRALDARTFALAAERRRLYGVPSISVGVEAGLPGSSGLLPTVGVSLPLLLLSRNRGEIRLATVERDRALATLDFARRDAAAALATSLRARELASTRVRQTRELLASAERIAALTLIAYREGEVALSFVLEATRRARDLRDGYITALSELVASQAGVHLYSLLAPPQ
jgi:outer membrane protein TolC